MVYATNSFYRSLDGFLFNKTKTTLVEFPGGLGGNYSDSRGVTRIGVPRSQVCTNLTSVTIPDSVTTIGEAAFMSA